MSLKPKDGNMTERLCLICGINIDGAHGNRKTCSDACSSMRQKEQYKEVNRRYRENNSEKIREKSGIYRENNLEVCREKGRIFRENNREKERERGRIYRENNRERILERGRERRVKATAAIAILQSMGTDAATD